MHKPFSRYWPMLLVALSLAALLAAGEFAWSRSAQAHYKECALLASAEPLKAMEEVGRWRRQTPASPLARHCNALALFSLKRQAEAAKELHLLANEAKDEQPALWASLVLQAEDAYYAGGKADEAIALLSDALQKNDLNSVTKAKFLAERGKLYYLQKRPDLALKDVNDSLALQPDQAELSHLVTEIDKKSSRPAK